MIFSQFLIVSKPLLSNRNAATLTDLTVYPPLTLVGQICNSFSLKQTMNFLFIFLLGVPVDSLESDQSRLKNPSPVSPQHIRASSSVHHQKEQKVSSSEESFFFGLLGRIPEELLQRALMSSSQSVSAHLTAESSWSDSTETLGVEPAPTRENKPKLQHFEAQLLLRPLDGAVYDLTKTIQTCSSSIYLQKVVVFVI